MTAAQKEALDKAHEMLGEHFDAHVIILKHETDDGCDDANISHGGGFYTALGLLARGYHSYAHADAVRNVTGGGE